MNRDQWRWQALCGAWLLFLIVLAEIRTDAQDAFAVASVKSNASGVPFSQSSDRADGVALVNERLRDLILFAYGIHEFQLNGGPDWVSRERFDIIARAEGPLSLEQKQAGLRQVLADRFGLRLQAETREQRVYRLARIPGTRAAGLLARDCATQGAFGLTCGRGLAAADGGVLRMGGIPMPRLAAFLSDVVGAVVVDYTGLESVYDVDLQWRQDTGLSPDLTDEARAHIESRPSLPAALREQLGLSLQPRRGAVTVFVIDNVERPAAD